MKHCLLFQGQLNCIETYCLPSATLYWPIAKLAGTVERHFALGTYAWSASAVGGSSSTVAAFAACLVELQVGSVKEASTMASLLAENLTTWQKSL